MHLIVVTVSLGYHGPREDVRGQWPLEMVPCNIQYECFGTASGMIPTVFERFIAL